MSYRLDYSQVLGGRNLDGLVGGIGATLALFVLCLVASLVLGMVVAVVRAAPFGPGRVAAAAFVGFQRNVPVLVHLLVWYFGIASVLPDPVAEFANDHGAEFFYAAVAFSLYGAAFVSEDLRGGFRAIPRTQYESARSMGLSFVLTMRLVILPQAVRHALPPLVGQALSLYKNTSVAAVIGVAELMYASREVATETFRVFEVFSVVTAVYFAGSMAVIAAGSALDRRLRRPGLAQA